MGPGFRRGDNRGWNASISLPGTDESAARGKTNLRIGQELRPMFFESEEQPHVKEVNAGSASRWEAAGEDLGALGKAAGDSDPRCPTSSRWNELHRQ